MKTNLKCFTVTCQDANMNIYKIGVMTFDESSACYAAEYSLYEGKHIKTKAIEVIETDRI